MRTPIAPRPRRPPAILRAAQPRNEWPDDHRPIALVGWRRAHRQRAWSPWSRWPCSHPWSLVAVSLPLSGGSGARLRHRGRAARDGDARRRNGAQPVLYVSSSDPRIGGGLGQATDVDTNSGVISRLTWTGAGGSASISCEGFRGSEEDHATNGLALDPARQTLYVAQGSNTNAGRPRAVSASSPSTRSRPPCSVDLRRIGDGTYDLPTLDDDTRGPAAGDPFGGERGENQARLVRDGPVQVYAAGFRNAYDLVLTSKGRLYTSQNGGAQELGAPRPRGPGRRVHERAARARPLRRGQPPPGARGAFYGHPNPTRGNRANTLLDGQSPVERANPMECDYRQPKDREPVALFPTSTNGLAEYTARARRRDEGTCSPSASTATSTDVELDHAANGPSKRPLFRLPAPLDVTAQGDRDPFPGTIWVAKYNGFVAPTIDAEPAGVPASGPDIAGDGSTRADRPRAAGGQLRRGRARASTSRRSDRSPGLRPPGGLVDDVAPLPAATSTTSRASRWTGGSTTSGARGWPGPASTRRTRTTRLDDRFSTRRADAAPARGGRRRRARRPDLLRGRPPRGPGGRLVRRLRPRARLVVAASRHAATARPLPGRRRRRQALHDRRARQRARRRSPPRTPSTSRDRSLDDRARSDPDAAAASPPRRRRRDPGHRRRGCGPRAPRRRGLRPGTDRWRRSTRCRRRGTGSRRSSAEGPSTSPPGVRRPAASEPSDVHEAYFPRRTIAAGCHSQCTLPGRPSGPGRRGTSSYSPTSLQFGPDGRLYVAQQDGMIKAYEVAREGDRTSSWTRRRSRRSAGSEPRRRRQLGDRRPLVRRPPSSG